MEEEEEEEEEVQAMHLVLVDLRILLQIRLVVEGIHCLLEREVIVDSLVESIRRRWMLRPRMRR